MIHSRVLGGTARHGFCLDLFGTPLKKAVYIGVIPFLVP